MWFIQMVNITVLPARGSSDAPELEKAYELAERLRLGFVRDEEGDVIIHASLRTYGYGQTYNDIDIAIFASFPHGIDRHSPCMVASTNGATRPLRGKETFRLYSLCMTLELKSHDPRGLQVQGHNLLMARYDDHWKDVSDQSEGQKQALRNVLKDKTSANCWVANGIWLTGVGRQDMPLGITNIIPADATFDDLLRVFVSIKAPYEMIPGGGRPFCSSFAVRDKESLTPAEVKKVFSEFAKKEVVVGSLTRQRVERITAQLLDDQQYAKEIGQKLVIIRGRAGTGKTIKLLRIAHDLANLKGARVRILTFNLALVSDIRRLTALSNVNEDTAGLVHVTSLDKFFYHLWHVCGLADDIPFDQYLERREDIIKIISEALSAGVASEADIEKWKDDPEFRFDYILIDEGQDWSKTEQNILVQIYGPSALLVADGVDQMIRRTDKSDWALSVPRKDVHQAPPERRCLRQKANLNSFNKQFAQVCDLSWDLLSRTDYPGGRIIITEERYTQRLHEELFEACQKDGNEAYEMLLMVPPSLANNPETNTKGFVMAPEFAQWGVRIWDGTQRDHRKEFPNERLEHRVIQYESCRGLEAWTAVCLYLDQLFEEKMRTWTRVEDQATFEDDEVLRVRDALRWCLIPLTRGIDTTLIVLSGIDNKLSQALRQVAKEVPDLVEWR